MPVNWKDLSRAEHQAVFNALATLHGDLIDAVQFGSDTTSGLLDSAMHITRELHRANDDLARREASLTGAPK